MKNKRREETFDLKHFRAIFLLSRPCADICPQWSGWSGTDKERKGQTDIGKKYNKQNIRSINTVMD